MTTYRLGPKHSCLTVLLIGSVKLLLWGWQVHTAVTLGLMT